ncbi:hypothetical protein M9194_09875 [Vibrio sp. S4M6]|uniref:helix-turn-helix transcriptional regulator n=1 Tax=Vibrio sinus TaxID=2946865 RepID=UPI00202A64B2|nr:hypothetical protein [Vibrio sinus]MCL9781733.1 hypothetical protein [Vibrio sinus]
MSVVERILLASDESEYQAELPILKRHSEKISKCTESIEKIIRVISPDLNLINFTFSRINDRSELSCVSLRPEILFGLYKLGLFKKEETLNLSVVKPIYSLTPLHNQEIKAFYKQTLNIDNEVTCIALDFELGRSKDSFYFLFEKDESKSLGSYYHLLHSLCLYFYKYFDQDKLELFFLSDLIKGNKSNREDGQSFSPFDSLKSRYDLTSIQLDYVKLVALEMEAKTISKITNRSTRTVESAISELKRKFEVDTKSQLEGILKLHYTIEANKYLKEQGLL